MKTIMKLSIARLNELEGTSSAQGTESIVEVMTVTELESYLINLNETIEFALNKMNASDDEWYITKQMERVASLNGLKIKINNILNGTNPAPPETSGGKVEEVTAENTTEMTVEESFEVAVEMSAQAFEEYYHNAMVKYLEEMEGGKNDIYESGRLRKKYGTLIADTLTVITDKDKLDARIKFESLNRAKSAILETKRKIENKLGGNIVKVEKASIGAGGTINGNFTADNGNTAYFYSILASGMIQLPHYRILNKEAK